MNVCSDAILNMSVFERMMDVDETRLANVKRQLIRARTL